MKVFFSVKEQQFSDRQTYKQGRQASTDSEDCGIPGFVTGIWKGAELGWNEMEGLSKG